MCAEYALEATLSALGHPTKISLGMEWLIALLALDFGVTRRFIEVRLRKYGLLPRETAVP